MEKKPPRPMTPFDEWTVPNELHTLKLLLPYTPAASQPALGMLIKVIELQHTMDYFQQKKNFIQSQDFSSGFSSPLDMLEEISPYLPPDEASMLNTFRNMMNIMDMVQMMQTFSDTSGDASMDSSVCDEDVRSTGSVQSENRNSSTGSKASGSQDASSKPGGFGSGFNPMNLVMGMLSPEQQEMFEMYQNMFSQPEESVNTSTEFSDDTAFATQDNVSHGNTASETQDDNFPDNASFETLGNDFTDNMTFEVQENDSSDNIVSETQNNNVNSNKERNDLDYE